MSTAYLIVEDPDGAQYAVPADSLHRHPAAKVIGREGDTGVPQPLETAPAETAPASTPEGAPAEQAPAPEPAAPTETPETPAP